MKKQKQSVVSAMFVYLRKKEQLSSKEISGLLKAFEKDILIHLQVLLSEDKITINNQNKFQLKI